MYLLGGWVVFMSDTEDPDSSAVGGEMAVIRFLTKVVMTTRCP